MTRPSVSHHLQILKEVGMVTMLWFYIFQKQETVNTLQKKIAQGTKEEVINSLERIKKMTIQKCFRILQRLL